MTVNNWMTGDYVLMPIVHFVDIMRKTLPLPGPGGLRQTAKGGLVVAPLLGGAPAVATAQTGAQIQVKAMVLSVTASRDGQAAALRLVQKGKRGTTEQGVATVQLVHDPQRSRRGGRIRIVIDYLRN